MTAVRDLLFLFVTMLAALLGCEQSGGPSGGSAIDQSTTIFPLAAGNAWTFQVTNRDTSGAVVGSWQNDVVIDRDTIIASERWFIGYGVLTNRSDGLYDYQDGSSSPVSLRYRFPVSAGSSYWYRGVVVKVLSVSDTVIVPAGTFVCCHFRTGIDSVSYSDEYLAQGVGIVKLEAYNPLPSGRVYNYLTYELTDVAIR